MSAPYRRFGEFVPGPCETWNADEPLDEPEEDPEERLYYDEINRGIEKDRDRYLDE